MIEAQPTADEEDRLAQLRALEILDTDADERFDSITRIAARLLDAPIALVSLVDAKRQWFKARVGLDPPELDRSISFCGHAIQARQPFVIPDTLRDDRFHDNPLVTGPPHIRSYVGQPIAGPGGALLGTVCIIDRKPRQFDADELATLAALGHWVELELAAAHPAGANPEAIVRSLNRARFWDLTQDLFCIAGTDAYFKDINPTFTKVLGFSREHLLSKPFLDFVHPDDVEATQAEVARLAHGLPTIHFENRYRRRDGEYVWLDWTATPRDDVLFAVARDVTQAKLLQKQLVDTTAALAQSNEELSMFASVASHDLQEPLRKITAFGSRLEETTRAGLGEQGRDYLGRMLGAADRMRALIDDLLVYARVTTKARPSEVVDLDGVVAAVLDDLAPAIAEAGAQVEVDQLPRVEADPVQMGQLLQNLISNAIRYRSPDRPAHIRIRAEGGDSEHRLAVTDNGIGFEAEYSERIFRPFERLHGRTEYAGTGMGLAICHKIVQRHGGSIAATSQPGHGSTFTVTLPKRRGVGDAQ